MSRIKRWAEKESNKVWEIDGKKVGKKLDADRKGWCCGKDVCEILGHENAKDTL